MGGRSGRSGGAAPTGEYALISRTTSTRVMRAARGKMDTAAGTHPQWQLPASQQEESPAPAP